LYGILTYFFELLFVLAYSCTVSLKPCTYCEPGTVPVMIISYQGTRQLTILPGCAFRIRLVVLFCSIFLLDLQSTYKRVLSTAMGEAKRRFHLASPRSTRLRQPRRRRWLDARPWTCRTDSLRQSSPAPGGFHVIQFSICEALSLLSTLSS